ncbi:MAG: beta-eliminating lyase-related protein [Gemmatimonadales bacterium]
MSAKVPVCEPHKIKTVRLLSFPTREERKKYLAEAAFNVFNLTPSQVSFDMCSLGTSAFSQEQLAGQLIGDEAYAGSRNFEHLQEAVREVLGHAYVCPTHNILGCLKLIVATLVPAGSVVPSNARGRIDVLTPQGVRVLDVRDRGEAIFTGNLDLTKLEEALVQGAVPIIDLPAFADGQHPFSLANLRAVRSLADRFGVRLIVDGSRVIENAWYIQRHEPGQADRRIAEIVGQIVKTGHILQLDGAQDPKSNTGGIITTDNPDDHEKFMNEVVVYEGLHTYGGMAGRTMEVLARGLREMCDEAEVRCWTRWPTRSSASSVSGTRSLRCSPRRWGGGGTRWPITGDSRTSSPTASTPSPTRSTRSSAWASCRAVAASGRFARRATTRFSSDRPM